MENDEDKHWSQQDEVKGLHRNARTVIWRYHSKEHQAWRCKPVLWGDPESVRLKKYMKNKLKLPKFQNLWQFMHFLMLMLRRIIICWSHKNLPVWLFIIRENQLGLVRLYKMHKDMVLLKALQRQRKKPKPLSSYVALMCDLVDKEPSCFEEAVQK